MPNMLIKNVRDKKKIPQTQMRKNLSLLAKAKREQLSYEMNETLCGNA